MLRANQPLPTRQLSLFPPSCPGPDRTSLPKEALDTGLPSDWGWGAGQGMTAGYDRPPSLHTLRHQPSTGLGQFPRQVGRVRQVDSGAFRTAGDMIRC